MPCSKALRPFVIAALVALGPLPAGAQNNAAPPPPAIAEQGPACAKNLSRCGWVLARSGETPIIAGQHNFSMLFDLGASRSGLRASDPHRARSQKSSRRRHKGACGLLFRTAVARLPRAGRRSEHYPRPSARRRGDVHLVPPGGFRPETPALRASQIRSWTT